METSNYSKSVPHRIDLATVGLDLYDYVQGQLKAGIKRIFLEPKRYFVNGDYLPRVYCCISNNESGMKSVLLDFANVQDVIIDGNGAEILCQGEILPIRVSNSQGIMIRNLSIDWLRPGMSHATVVSVEKNAVVFRYDPDLYPMKVVSGRLIAFDEWGWQTDILMNLLEYDQQRGQLRDGATENWHLRLYHYASEIDDHHIRIEADFDQLPEPGSLIGLMHGDRYAPGVWVAHSRDVVIEGVCIHHALGMGFINQCSQNISLIKCSVVPCEGRLFSTWVDAAHFVDCDGDILVDSCRFSGQWDDAINLHGIFWKGLEFCSGNSIRCQVMHRQQIGVNIFRVGDTAVLHNRLTLAELKRCEVTDIDFDSLGFPVLSFNSDMSDLDPSAIVIRRYSKHCNLVVRNSKFEQNRGRGLLLMTPGKILVENNYFHVSGIAIESVCDTTYWWESGPIDSLEIRHNDFDGCNFAACSGPLIYIHAESEKQTDLSLIHGRVQIQSNTYNTRGEQILHVSNTKLLVHDLSV